MAAVLACGPDALLSHRSAVSLWELRPVASGPIDVTVPGGGRSRKGIRMHEARNPDPADWTVRDGIPVTSLHRTILDYADVAKPQQVRLAIDRADRLELFDLRQLEALIARSPGRRGIKPLKVILNEIKGPAPRTRSELEREALALLRAAGIPEAQTNGTRASGQKDRRHPDHAAARAGRASGLINDIRQLLSAWTADP